MNPFKLDINETTRFLLPILLPNTTYEELIANYLKQAYIGILDNPEYDDEYLVIEFNSEYFTPDVYEAITSLDTEGLISNQEDNLVIFKLPEHLKEDYDKFINGKYSHFSKESKEAILSFWGEEDDEDSILRAILYKNWTEQVKSFMSGLIGKELVERLDRAEKQAWNGIEIWKAPSIPDEELLYRY